MAAIIKEVAEPIAGGFQSIWYDGGVGADIGGPRMTALLSSLIVGSEAV